MNPVWIGKFEVSAAPENEFLEGDAGAFVWVAAQAVSAENLVQRMTHSMKELGLTVIDSQDVQEVIDETTLSDLFSIFCQKRNATLILLSAELGTDSKISMHRYKDYPCSTPS